MGYTYGMHMDTAVELLILMLGYELIVMEHLQGLFLNNDAIKNVPVLWGVKLINICVTGASIFLDVINATKVIRETKGKICCYFSFRTKIPCAPFLLKTVLYRNFCTYIKLASTLSHDK